LTALSPPKPHKIKPGKGSKLSLFIREIRVECVPNKSKSQIFLLMVKVNTSKVVTLLSLKGHQELENEIPKEPITKISLPIKSVLEESVHEDDQAMNDPSIKCKELGLSYDDYIGIFNELMGPKRTTHYFDVLLKILNKSYVFKKGGVLSMLGIFKPKCGNKFLRWSDRFQPQRFVVKSFSSGGG